MRILHLAPRLSARGGADWDLLGLLGLLTPAHEQVLAVARIDDAGLAPPGVQVEVVAGLDARTAVTVDLARLVRRHTPALVHVHNLVNPRLLDAAARQGAILTLQDHRAFCPGRGKWTAAGEVCTRPLERARCRACFDDDSYAAELWDLTTQRLQAVQGMRAITVLSHHMREQLMQAGVDGQRVQVIPPFAHGLDAAAAPDGPPCALFVGRVVEAKGVLDTIAAWRRSGLELPLKVAGTGSLRTVVEAQGVQVLGWVDRPRLSALYRSALVVVMPSRWQEPFGIVGLEALSLGVPVAAWRSGGVEEWHPGGSGLVAWGDVDALAQAVRQVAGTSVSTPLPTPPGFAREDARHRWDALLGGL